MYFVTAADSVVTVLGNTSTPLLAGVFVVEAIFNWAGSGMVRRTRHSGFGLWCYRQHHPGSFAVCCVTMVNLIVDLLYLWLDPRIQLA